MNQRLLFRINLLLLALWFGGFTVYAGIVIPIGSELIGETTQGFITQKVSFWLNLIGIIAIISLGIWIFFFQRIKKFLLLYALLVFSLIGQLYLHGVLTHQLDMEAMEVSSGNFYRFHQIYLWLSTLQWLAMLGSILCITDPSEDRKG